MGLQRPTDHDDSTDASGLGDALSELPEARIVRAPGTPHEVLQSDATTLMHVASDPSPRATAGGITYPEWDHRKAAYRFPGAIVWPAPASAGGFAWAARVLDQHATLVRQVRRRFGGLRPRRVRLGRQPDGAELDLGAYVTAFADWRAGEPGDDRLYAASRPARRDLAIAVLADVSASTDAWVAGNRRIVDVEKEALVVLLEALDVLGDRHTVLAFSGQGPRAVHVLTVKGFDEASGGGGAASYRSARARRLHPRRGRGPARQRPARAGARPVSPAPAPLRRQTERRRRVRGTIRHRGHAASGGRGAPAGAHAVLPDRRPGSARLSARDLRAARIRRALAARAIAHRARRGAPLSPNHLRSAIARGAHGGARSWRQLCP